MPVTSPAPKTPARFERLWVHLQPAALGLCERGPAPCLYVGAAARGNQQPIRRDDGTGFQMEDDTRVLALFDGDTRVPDHQRDAVRLEVRPERHSGVRLFEAKERRASFDQRHLGAKARERLPQFHANRTGAEDRQRCGQLTRNRRVAVSPELDGVKARNGRNRCRAAGGDHHGTARDQLFTADGDRAEVRQSSFAANQRGARRLHRGSRPRVIEVACHPPHAFGNLGKIDRPVDERCSKDTSAIGLAQCFAGAKQGLGRHAAPVRALASDQLSLDHRKRQPAVLKTAGDRFSGDATTETHDVIFLFQVRTP
jgi:hypothetical protein